jgi:tRNA(fMet)-specific endonuclease VapC
MKYLLDTNTCIRYLNGRSPRVRQKLDSLEPSDIAVPSIVKAELFFGSRKSENPEYALVKQRKFLQPFVSLPFDDDAAEAYGIIRAYLEKQGTPIGPNDVIVASLAISNNLILVSHNTREFSRVPNIHLEDWEAE